MSSTAPVREFSAKKVWVSPQVTSLESADTEAKISSPGENGIVTGPS